MRQLKELYPDSEEGRLNLRNAAMREWRRFRPRRLDGWEQWKRRYMFAPDIFAQQLSINRRAYYERHKKYWLGYQADYDEKHAAERKRYLAAYYAKNKERLKASRKAKKEATKLDRLPDSLAAEKAPEIGIPERNLAILEAAWRPNRMDGRKQRN